MAGLSDARDAAQDIVGPICGYKARSFSEAEVGRMLHSYLIGCHGGVDKEHQFKIGATNNKLDFRFGDWPYGANPCVLELAVRTSEGGQQLGSATNRTELRKLARYPKSRAATRILLLIDLGHDPITQASLQPGYDNLDHMGAGRFERNAVSVLYVHRDLDYRFIWRPWA